MYESSRGYTYILHRLVSAAATPDICNRMNAEDEFFKALEDRDTEIMQSKKLLQEKEVAIQRQEATIQQKNATIRAAVSALYQMGMSVADIAKKMEMDEEVFSKDSDTATVSVCGLPFISIDFLKTSDFT